MLKLILRRVTATFLDYLLIGTYALMLWLVFSQFSFPTLGPVSGQFIGFFSLTLPALLYVYFTEKGRHHATLGKLALGLKVNKRNPSGSVLIRNVLKFLPWEIAHTGVHWMFYYELMDINPPLWIWLLLIFPQVVIIIYFLSLFLSGGKETLYDKLAHTAVNTE
jgi:uncharacterized RDD family membrane protein YckC